ncbi:MAG: YdcF family protein, partial [Leptolyngbya sp. SIO3F4]|nr:YdcF family protein [Leptolyngbya sp. SIO3F4]
MVKAKLSQRYLRYAILGLLLTVAIATLVKVGNLWRSSQLPTDAYLVLGGSIRREMYMAQLASERSQPILISAGSADPCIRLLFEQAEAPLEQVWLEHCAES